MHDLRRRPTPPPPPMRQRAHGGGQVFETFYPGRRPHVTELARRFQSQLLLVHVADGWVARNFNRLKLAESEEMKADRIYLESTAAQLRAAGLTVAAHLALGEPPAEILRTATKEK